VTFIAHALRKYAVFTLPGAAKFFSSIGLPGPLAYVVFFAELIGGAPILLGLGTRWVAALLMPILLGATWAHLGNGWLFSAANGGWEYPLFLTLASVALALLGDGRATSPMRPAVEAKLRERGRDEARGPNRYAGLLATKRLQSGHQRAKPASQRGSPKPVMWCARR
jgi:putative oxidoreductase